MYKNIYKYFELEVEIKRYSCPELDFPSTLLFYYVSTPFPLQLSHSKGIYWTLSCCCCCTMSREEGLLHQMWLLQSGISLLSPALPEEQLRWESNSKTCFQNITPLSIIAPKHEASASELRGATLRCACVFHSAHGDAHPLCRRHTLLNAHLYVWFFSVYHAFPLL